MEISCRVADPALINMPDCSSEHAWAAATPAAGGTCTARTCSGPSLTCRRCEGPAPALRRPSPRCTGPGRLQVPLPWWSDSLSRALVLWLNSIEIDYAQSCTPLHYIPAPARGEVRGSCGPLRCGTACRRLLLILLASSTVYQPRPSWSGDRDLTPHCFCFRRPLASQVAAPCRRPWGQPARAPLEQGRSPLDKLPCSRIAAEPKM